MKQYHQLSKVEGNKTFCNWWWWVERYCEWWDLHFVTLFSRKLRVTMLLCWLLVFTMFGTRWCLLIFYLWCLWTIFSMCFPRWAWWSTLEQLYMKEIHDLWEKHRAKFLFMFFIFGLWIWLPLNYNRIVSLEFLCCVGWGRMPYYQNSFFLSL
jgi:hypothetical protein